MNNLSTEIKRRSRFEGLEDYINLTKMVDTPDAFKRQPRIQRTNSTAVPENIPENTVTDTVVNTAPVAETSTTPVTSTVPTAQIQTDNMASSTPKSVKPATLNLPTSQQADSEIPSSTENAVATATAQPFIPPRTLTFHQLTNLMKTGKSD